jgi:16S rRNA A1518/A1519 N6-dimethyltransferase RsmA/KsgA/DIM1 with predicted DNA glycosylase/AP lyase activity
MKSFKEAIYAIGNFPYNISTQIVLKRWSSNIKSRVCRDQKEVAERIYEKKE